MFVKVTTRGDKRRSDVKLDPGQFHIPLLNGLASGTDGSKEGKTKKAEPIK